MEDTDQKKSIYDFESVEAAVQKFWTEKGIYYEARTKAAAGPKFFFLDGPPYTSGKALFSFFPLTSPLMHGFFPLCCSPATGRVHVGTAWNKILKDVKFSLPKIKIELTIPFLLPHRCSFDTSECADSMCATVQDMVPQIFCSPLHFSVANYVFLCLSQDMHGLPTEKVAEAQLKISGRDQIEAFGVEKFIEHCRKVCVTNMLEMNKTFKSLGTNPSSLPFVCALQHTDTPLPFFSRCLDGL
jgi:isoleucyl-tRNA synthetase